MNHQAKQLQSLLKQKYHSMTEQIQPLSQNIYTKIIDWQKTQYEQIKKLINQTNNKMIKIHDKSEECRENINEITSKNRNNTDFNKKADGFLKSKDEQVKSKIKALQSVSMGIKQTVSKIKPSKLKKLPVQKNRTLLQLFEILFQVLYKEDKAKFNWQTFRKLALKHQNGEDFIYRMININFRQLPENSSNLLLELKNDKQFDNLCCNSKYAYDIIDVADWVQYVCLGHNFSLEKIKAQKEQDKIHKQVAKNQKGSLKMTQDFWKEAYQEISIVEKNVKDIESELNNITIVMNSQIQDLQELHIKRNERIQILNQMALI